MALETATYPNDLNSANPPSTDPKSQGDDHLRLIKKTLHNAFAGFTGQVIVTGTETQGATAPYNTTNDYVATIVGDGVSVPTAYQDRMIVIAKSSHTNIAGACTFGIGTIGQLPLLGIRGESLMAGDLPNGWLFGAIYDAGSSSWYLVTPNDRVSRNGDTIASLIVAGALTVSGLTTLVNLAISGTATGTTPTAGDNSTNLATTAYVVAAVLGASVTIPGQTGHAGHAIVTDGISANWGIDATTALAARAVGIF